MLPQPIVIQAKYMNNCIKCNHTIDIGDTCFWTKGEGIFCYPKCPEPVTKDNSELVIIEDERLGKTIKTLSRKYF